MNRTLHSPGVRGGDVYSSETENLTEQYHLLLNASFSTGIVAMVCVCVSWL